MADNHLQVFCGCFSPVRTVFCDYYTSNSYRYSVAATLLQVLCGCYSPLSILWLLLVNFTGILWLLLSCRYSVATTSQSYRYSVAVTVLPYNCCYYSLYSYSIATTNISFRYPGAPATVCMYEYNPEATRHHCVLTG